MSVVASLAMSIDGFIADPDDGCEELFGFYENGETELQIDEGRGVTHLRYRVLR